MLQKLGTIDILDIVQILNVNMNGLKLKKEQFIFICEYEQVETKKMYISI